MQLWLSILGLVFLPAYLVGSIPYGFIFGRLKGIDIRIHGSGNIGATNVWRVLGRNWGILTFVLDFLKVPMGSLMATALVRHFQITGAPDWAILIIPLLGGVLGHNYPVWLCFRGGKGIATSAGGLLWIMPAAFGVVLLVWALIFLLTRYVALASIAAATALPIVAYFFYRGQSFLLALSLFLCVMAIWRHRGNIQRLCSGTEHRWTKKKTDPAGS